MPLRSDEVTELQSGLVKFILPMQADASGLRITALRLEWYPKSQERRVHYNCTTNAF